VLIAILYALCLLFLSGLSPAGGPANVDEALLEPASEAATVPRVTLTVLYDNHASPPGTTADHGFACLVEGLEKTVLFDTGGSGTILLDNMQALDIRPDDIDIVVLSHEHRDHIGGLAQLLTRNPDIDVYYPVSFSDGFARSARASAASVVPVETPESLCPGLSVTGLLGDSPKELGLVIQTAKGAVLLTGCAHPGIAAMTEAASELVDGPVIAVLGGFHLSSRSAAQVDEIISRLKKLGVRQCGPAHCTGDAATAQMRRAFGEGFIEMGVGTVVIF